MADEELVELLKSDVSEWNKSWETSPKSGVDLSNADLREAKLSGANLWMADLREADLSEANLSGAVLSRADLGGANLSGAIVEDATIWNANLFGANLSEAVLTGTALVQTNLTEANLTEAKLDDANLTRAVCEGATLTRADLTLESLVQTNFRNADLMGCRIFGASVWEIETDNKTKQSGLIISNYDEPNVMVDDLEVAQFIYLLLNHKKLRNVLNATTQKGVLILGRFKDGGLEVLQAVAARIREMDYLPMLFDFERSDSKDFTETVKTMIGLARFVIADLSGPSVLKELEATVPGFKLPFIPMIEEGRKLPRLSVDFADYPWFRWPPVIFANKDLLIEMLPEKVIDPAEEIAKERQERRAKLYSEAV